MLDDEDDDEDGVASKRPRLDDNTTDDNIDNTGNNKADTSLSWPHCFTTDRLADNQAVMPFER